MSMTTRQLAVVGLAIALVACSAQTSPSEPIPTPSPSETQQPSTAAATAEPSAPPSTLASADVTTVTIRDRSFGAPEITVAVGKVTFVNADSLPHTVTEGQNGAAGPNARVNEVVGVGDSLEVTFADVGDYQITCLFHSEMHLLVHAH
jgi:plastocyanin